MYSIAEYRAPPAADNASWSAGNAHQVPVEADHASDDPAPEIAALTRSPLCRCPAPCSVSGIRNDPSSEAKVPEQSQVPIWRLCSWQPVTVKVPRMPP
jgi:hypothetical protein